MLPDAFVRRIHTGNDQRRVDPLKGRNKIFTLIVIPLANLDAKITGLFRRTGNADDTLFPFFFNDLPGNSTPQSAAYGGNGYHLISSLLFT
jgi:hypothetical protein